MTTNLSKQIRALALLALVAACSQFPTQTAIPLPSSTPLPSATPAATLTVTPTATPIPIVVESLEQITPANASRLTRLGSIGIRYAINSNWPSAATDGRVLAIATVGGFYVFDLDPIEERYFVEAEVFSIGISPNGNQIVTTGGYGGKIQFWDAVTGKKIHALNLPVSDDIVYKFAFSSDGKRLAAAGGKSTTVWNLDEKKVEHSFGGAQAIALSPDGQIMAKSIDGPTGAFEIWETQSGTRIDELEAKGFGNVKSLAINPDATMIAAGLGSSRNVVIFDLASKKITKGIRCQSPVTSVVFSPDGKWLLVSADATYLWNMDGSHKPVRLVPNGDQLAGDLATQAMFVDDGKKVVSVSNDYIAVWDIATLSLTQVIDYGAFDVAQMRFMPDGKLIVVSPSRVSVIDPARQVITRIVERFSADAYSHRQAIAAHVPIVGLVTDSTISIIDATTGQPVQAITEASIPNPYDHWNSRPAGVALSPKGDFVALFVWAGLTSVSTESRLRIWSVPTGNNVLDLTEKIRYIRDFAFSPANKFIAIAYGEDGVDLKDLNGTVVAHFSGIGSVHRVDFDPTGSRIVANVSSGDIYMYDISSTHIQKIPNVAWSKTFFSDDGNLIIAGNSLLDSRDFTRLVELNTGSRGDWRAFSPDGKLIATDTGGQIVFWGVPLK